MLRPFEFVQHLLIVCTEKHIKIKICFCNFTLNFKISKIYKIDVGKEISDFSAPVTTHFPTHYLQWKVLFCVSVFNVFEPNTTDT